jgi:hypothetical protein
MHTSCLHNFNYLIIRDRLKALIILWYWTKHRRSWCNNFNFCITFRFQTLYCIQKSYGVRRKRTRRGKMTNHTYVVIVFNMIQSKVPFQILLHNSLAIIISYCFFTGWVVISHIRNSFRYYHNDHKLFFQVDYFLVYI